MPRVPNARDQLREIERLAQLGSWEWDVVNDQISWSDELYRIYGVEPQSFPATYDAFLGMIHDNDRDLVDATVRRAFVSHSPYAFEHRLIRPDGATRWLHGRGHVETDNDGNVVRLYGVAIDITDQKEMARDQMEFVANAAHELRTPISAIVSAVGLLRQEDEVDPTLGELLSRNADRLMGITESLLDLTALHHGTRTVDLQPVVLRSALDAAIMLLGDLLSDTDLRIDVGDDLVVIAGLQELSTVLTNVLQNAAAYGGPEVVVSASSDDGEVTLGIADNGPGVPIADRARLFTPFGLKSSSPGSHGLGLSIVSQYMKAFGGAISYRPGVPSGSIFELRFGTP